MTRKLRVVLHNKLIQYKTQKEIENGNRSCVA